MKGLHKESFPRLRIYKGYFYWGRKGAWYCDIFQEPFNTIKEFKEYINDRIDCGQ